MARDDYENCAGRPRGQSCEQEGSANIAPPETRERMKDEPVDWNGKVQKENDESQIAEESHEAS